MPRPKKLVQNQLYIFTVRFTRSQYTRLRALARYDSNTQQNHVRRALEEYLAKQVIPPELIEEVVKEDVAKSGITAPMPTPIMRRKSLPKAPVAA